jgi:uncharacterized protein
MSGDSANADPVQRLLRTLGTYTGVLVAFSGGVDSALLLAASVRALPEDRVLAVTAVSDSLPAAELAIARDFTARLGVRHIEAPTYEMQREGYRQNGTDRCYFCKAELLDVVVAHLAQLPAGSRVATGTNADDVTEGFRPGIRAAAQRGAVTPLADAGMSKELVRATARMWDLPVWDKPQSACLSSRIAYGIPISRSRLARVEAAEIAVRASMAAHGVETVNVRVRDLGNGARIEVDRELLDLPGEWRQAAAQAVEATGFANALIDPRGFRSGSMNDGRSQPHR